MIQKIKKKDFHNFEFLSPLLNIYDCPEQIYYRGDVPNKNKNTKVLCVIGSRRATNYGKEVTDFLLSGLAGEDIIIVSGLALGIDTRAHTAALANKLKTVSFPGSGLNMEVLYPRANINLADEIINSGGCMMSEYAPDTKSALHTFPARNRLMAAVSDLVLIIEAQEKSGTQITARLALEYGKDLAIVPGSIFSIFSNGTAQLYKSGANPVTCSQDILDLLKISNDSETKKLNQMNMFELENENNLNSLTEQEKIILKLLDTPLGKDEIINESGLLAHEAIIAITNLEAKKYIIDSFGEIKRIK